MRIFSEKTQKKSNLKCEKSRKVVASDLPPSFQIWQNTRGVIVFFRRETQNFPPAAGSFPLVFSQWVVQYENFAAAPNVSIKSHEWKWKTYLWHEWNTSAMGRDVSRSRPCSDNWWMLVLYKRVFRFQEAEKTKAKLTLKHFLRFSS